MALSRVKTWGSGEVLTDTDLNGEFNNILNNPVALISPLTGNVDVDGQDLQDADEVEFRDAASNASAAGRLRRNGTRLTWHNGTAAKNLAYTDEITTGGASGVGTYTVRGLTGTNSATANTTMFTMTANQVVTWRATDNVAVLATTVPTVSLDSGIYSVNGRDHSPVFPADSFLHAYWISNGATINGILSATAPPTGPIMPSGYTGWAYAHALRWNHSSQFATMYLRGDWCYYATGVNVLIEGTATNETTVTISGAVPTNADTIGLMIYRTARNTEIIRVLTSNDYTRGGVVSAGNVGDVTYNLQIPNVGQQVRYFDTTSNATHIDVVGFSISNGS